jgi:hypothetical protein
MHGEHDQDYCTKNQHYATGIHTDTSCLFFAIRYDKKSVAGVYEERRIRTKIPAIPVPSSAIHTGRGE